MGNSPSGPPRIDIPVEQPPGGEHKHDYGNVWSTEELEYSEREQARFIEYTEECLSKYPSISYLRIRKSVARTIESWLKQVWLEHVFSVKITQHLVILFGEPTRIYEVIVEKPKTRDENKAKLIKKKWPYSLKNLRRFTKLDWQELLDAVAWTVEQYDGYRFEVKGEEATDLIAKRLSDRGLAVQIFPPSHIKMESEGEDIYKVEATNLPINHRYMEIYPYEFSQYGEIEWDSFVNYTKSMVRHVPYIVYTTDDKELAELVAENHISRGLSVELTEKERVGELVYNVTIRK